MKYFDPPSGWRYGFPLPVREDDDLIEVLRKAGYPEKDIPFAMKHSRFWYVPMEKENAPN